METRELRRNRDMLKITGLGVIAFGLWNMIKIFMYVMIEKAAIYEMIRDSIDSDVVYTDKEMNMLYLISYIIFVVIMMLVMVFDALIRLYVGRCAILEAKGIKKGNAYLVIAAIMIMVSVLSMVNAVMGFKPDPDTVIDIISTVLVEITSFITLVELFITVRRVR